MRPKILVSRKISDLAEEKLQKEFEVTLNPKDEPILESDLIKIVNDYDCLLYTSPSPRDGILSRMPSSA